MSIFAAFEMKKIPHRPTDTRPDKALVISFHGKGHLLDHQGEGIAYELEAVGDSYLVEHSMLPPESDGLWVWEGQLHWSQDYYGEADCYLDGAYREATEEEWQRFLNGEYIWDPTPEEIYAWDAAAREEDEALHIANEKVINWARFLLREHGEKLVALAGEDESLVANLRTTQEVLEKHHELRGY